MLLGSTDNFSLQLLEILRYFVVLVILDHHRLEGKQNIQLPVITECYLTYKRLTSLRRQTYDSATAIFLPCNQNLNKNIKFRDISYRIVHLPKNYPYFFAHSNDLLMKCNNNDRPDVN